MEYSSLKLSDTIAKIFITDLIPLCFSTAGPKGNEDQKRLTVHYRTSQHYQENVFIEGSRPQYLEDLHTEAQEGLKILQQEGHYKHIPSYCRHSLAYTCNI